MIKIAVLLKSGVMKIKNILKNKDCFRDYNDIKIFCKLEGIKSEYFISEININGEISDDFWRRNIDYNMINYVNDNIDYYLKCK